MSCPDCAEAQAAEWHGFTNGCKACVARGLARVFLRRGERGRRLRMACSQLGVTEQQVRDAWKADAMNKERTL